LRYEILGIGGFEYGIQRAYENQKSRKITFPKDNIRYNGNKSDSKRGTWGCCACVGYSEIDKYAVQVYQKHFPDHRNFGDATKIIPREIPDFDLLVGGFPCQAFSIAGKRKGFDDTRGTLFFEIARILKDKRPRYFLLENVKGLLSHEQGKTFQTILGVLTDLGYGVEWQVLNSKNFGVPQNRERVFIIGHLGGFRGQQVFPIGESDRTDNEIITEINTGHQGNTVYNSKGLSSTLNSYGGGQGGKTGLYSIADFRYDDGLRIRKNNIPPTVRAEFKSQDMSKSALVIEPYIKSNPHGFNKGGNREYPNVRESAIQNEFVNLSPTIGANDTRKNYSGQNKKFFEKTGMIRRLTPTECERLQGFPDGWTEGLSDTQRYKCLGNAVTTNVVEAIIYKFITI